MHKFDTDDGKKWPEQPTSMVTKETLKSASSRSETKGQYRASFLELAALVCTSLLVTTDGSKSMISLLENKTMSKMWMIQSVYSYLED